MGIDLRALAVTVLLAFALYFTYGQFELRWMTVLPIVLALAICSLPTPRWLQTHIRYFALAAVLFFLGTSAVSLLPESPRLRSMIVDVADQSYLPAMRAMFGLAAAACIALFLTPRFHVWIFGFILACMIGAFALVIPTSPRPQIDVWTVHEEGAQAFVEGRNPYTHEYTNIYSEELRPFLTPGGVTYSYMPGVFMWMAPWKALGLDTRYSQLVTRLCTAVLLFLITLRVSGRRESFMTFVPALLFITFPLNTFFIVRAWNDDISMMCYALAGYAMITRRPWALFIATNFLLLHKQHAIFFVPVLIWYAWRAWGDRLAWLRATAFAALVCSGYLIADWRNFLGSLYGLTFLKFPNIHTVFLERRDPYSLMNYLNLYAGFKSSWFFLVVVAAIGFLVLRANWRTPNAASVLRGIGAMALALFAFAPIAFANYYQFALGLILIGYAASGPRVADREWEPALNWWQLSYIAVRSFILFNFASLIVETRDIARAASAANFFSAQNYEFLSLHTWWQLAMLVCDIMIASIIFKQSETGRTSKLALSFFVFGPLFIGPLWFTSAVLLAALFIWFVAVWMKRRSSHARAGALVSEKFDGRSHAQVALAVGTVIGLGVWFSDLAGFESGFQTLLSPSHALMWMLILLPLCPPIKLTRRSRVVIPAFTITLLVALALTAMLLFSFEAAYVNSELYRIELSTRLAFILLSVVLLAVTLRKERSV